MKQQTEVPPPRIKQRLIGLDVLRFVAVMLVLGRHMWDSPESWSNVWKSPFLIWKRGGWVGVDLFFVLSGFLVSGLLFAEYKSRGNLSIGRFYTRRGWKIYPPFFVFIVATVIVNLICDRPLYRRALASEFMFLQSYMYGLWNHTWSLAVEEHFYLLLPLVLIVVMRLNRGSPTPLKPVLGLAVGVAASALILRLLNWQYRPSYSHHTHLFASHLRLDSLFFGVAISYAYHFHTGRFVTLLSPWRRWLVAGGILLITPAFIFQLEVTPFIYTLGLTQFYLGSGMLLVGILLCDMPRNRLLVIVATLGAYSYSIYLWHMAVGTWGVSLIQSACDAPLGFGGKVVIYLIGSFILGVVMAKAVEVPTLRLRDRWFPPRGKGPIKNQSLEAS